MRGAIHLSIIVALVLAACSGDTQDVGSTVSSPPPTPVSSPVEAPWQELPSDVPVGTWIGDLVEPGVAIYETEVTIRLCDEGEPCGRFREATRNYRGTGESGSCGGTLTYDGMEGNAVVFREYVSYNRPVGLFNCALARMFLSRIDEGTLRVKEYWEGMFSSHGILSLADGS